MTTTRAQYRLEEDDAASSIAACLTSVGDIDCGPAENVKYVFFDTFDWRLYAGGKSVDVRSEGRGSEVHFRDCDRQETIAITPGGLPTGFAADFPPGRVRDLMTEIIDVRRLLPRLEVISKHTPIAVRDKEGKTILRLALDTFLACHPVGNRAAVPLGTHLTVEPVRGYTKAEIRARKILNDGYATLPAGVPLHIEGLQAIGVTPGDYSSKFRLDLKPSMTAGEAARQVHLALLDAMERNEDGVVDQIDPEFLHDFRVAVRRTRSALDQLDKGVLPAAVIARVKTDFRWIGQQTNHMRDLDVYLIDYPKLQSTLPAPYKPHLQPFHDYLIAQRQAEIRKVAAMIRGQRYRRIRDDWHLYLTDGFEKAEHTDTPVKELSDARIWKSYRRVMKMGDAINDSSPVEALHDLRIACKKLRYLLEFFRSLYPPTEIGALVKSLKAFQNVLGEFQDTEVQSLAILSFGREMATAGVAPVETQMAMGMVAESILQRQDIARLDFHNRLEAFSRAGVRERFSSLFKNRG